MRRWPRLAFDTRAGVALVFALTLTPILGCIGLAVDFGFVSQARVALDLAADTAALSAVKTAGNAASSGIANPATLGAAAAQQWFLAQAQLLPNVKAATPVVTVTQNGTVFFATVKYQAQVSLFFSAMFGVRTASVSDTAVSTMTSNTYLDVSFLLDNSGSMLLASTQDGITQLNSLTQPYKGFVPDGLQGHQCAFACHWQMDPSKSDYYSIAKGGNAQGVVVQLRTDVLKLAMNSALQTMKQADIVTDQFGVGVIAFDDALHQIYPAGNPGVTTTDIADAAASLSAIPVPCCQDVANTNFPAIMASLAAAAPPSGDGTTPAKRKKVLIIITDGMADYGARQVPDSKGPFKPADCNAIKALGYTVYVLYTPYSSDPSALLYNEPLLPYLTPSPSIMDTNLQQCASDPGNFKDASTPDAIIAALNQLLLSAIGSAGRFTQ